jgi:hypothetical protein
MQDPMIPENRDAQTVLGGLPVPHALSGIRTGMTLAYDAELAAAEIHAALNQPDLKLVVLFVRSDIDLHRFAAACQRLFGPTVTLVGCTTAGEITAQGYVEGAITGLSLSGDNFAVSAIPIEGLQTFTVNRGQDLVRRGVQDLARHAPSFTRQQMFAFTLIDGLCGCEEAVVSSLHAALGEIPLFGGSAGDSLRFEKTYVLNQGTFRDDMGLMVLVASKLPFRVFKTEHFIADAHKMVVTEADPISRIVSEINAEPAAQEYARLIGMESVELSPMVFATHPVVVRVGGQNFVRSIQKVNDDDSLTFFCAIDEGIVLTVAKGVDLAENLDQLFQQIRSEIGQPRLVLGFDCIFRSLEISERGLRPRVDQMIRDNNVIGFATYGEQFHAMHVNQTFTGVAIGSAPEPALIAGGTP